MHAADVLTRQIARTGSIACVGLDPRPNLLPPAVIEKALATRRDPAEAVAAAFTAFNYGILDAVAGACACVKPQMACYEAYGWAGLRALAETVAYARHLDIPVILDGKRNDIGSTAEHYQQAQLGTAPGLQDATCPGLGGQWATVNGYLGSDGITPFLGKQPSTTGIFVLVKTSNPSSGELQDLALASDDEGTSTVMEAMAGLVHRLGSNRLGTCGLSDIGAVVGATYPFQAKRLRRLMPNTLFLVPGYGAQGGTADDALAGVRSDGTGVIINSSRGIIGAWQKNHTDDWAAAARVALNDMNKDINARR